MPEFNFCLPWINPIMFSLTVICLIARVSSFVAWTTEPLSTDQHVRTGSFLVPGIVGVLAALFKVVL